MAGNITSVLFYINTNFPLVELSMICVEYFIKKGGYMLLDDFVGKRINMTKFSESIGYTRSYITNVMSGRFKMTEKLAKALEEASDGKLKAKQLIKAHHKRFEEKLYK